MVVRFLFLLFLWWTGPALAESFLCAGSQGTLIGEILPAGGAAKPARIAASTTGTRRALVLFACGIKTPYVVRAVIGSPYSANLEQHLVRRSSGI